jgi:hypothetical protein
MRSAPAGFDVLREQIGQQQTEIEHRKQHVEPPAAGVTNRGSARDPNNSAAHPRHVLHRSSPRDSADIEPTTPAMAYNERRVGQQRPLSRRRSGPPLIEGASAKPIGKKRVLVSSPAPAANAVPPPDAKMLRAANCAVPDQTTADIRIDGIGPSSGPASKPKLIPTAAIGNARGSEARRPSGPALGVHTLANNRYDLPRVAYGVCVGRVIRGARRGLRLPTMDSNICTRKRCPRYGSRISRQASSSSSSPVRV